jgi:hypothetical protein
MSWLSFLKKLYSLDTLDTRFTTSTKTPHKITTGDSIADSKLPAQEVLQSGKNQPPSGTQPSKWNTPEFYFYYLCFLTIPIFMVKAVYDISQGRFLLCITKNSY